MRVLRRLSRLTLTLPIVAFLLVLEAPSVQAHCDAIDGPVVRDARHALESGDATPVMKWVDAHDEAEVRAAFGQALAVRAQSPEARELADRYFFETVVRLHRASEGAPYTGLKPAGSDFGPAVHAADRAIERGRVEEVAHLVLAEAERGLHERFDTLMRLRERADHNVEAGRAFVHAYADFIHYAKNLHELAAAAGPAGAHDQH